VALLLVVMWVWVWVEEVGREVGSLNPGSSPTLCLRSACASKTDHFVRGLACVRSVRVVWGRPASTSLDEQAHGHPQTYA